MPKRSYSAEEKYEILKALGDEHSTHEIALSAIRDLYDGAIISYTKYD